MADKHIDIAIIHDRKLANAPEDFPEFFGTLHIYYSGGCFFQPKDEDIPSYAKYLDDSEFNELVEVVDSVVKKRKALFVFSTDTDGTAIMFERGQYKFCVYDDNESGVVVSCFDKKRGETVNKRLPRNKARFVKFGNKENKAPLLGVMFPCGKEIIALKTGEIYRIDECDILGEFSLDD